MLVGCRFAFFALCSLMKLTSIPGSQVISIYDLNNREALQASLRMRLHARNVVESPEAVREAISMVGGRLSYLSRISKSRNMMEMATHLLGTEKGVSFFSLSSTGSSF